MSTPKNVRTLLSAGLVVFGASLIVVACGSSDDNTSPGGPLGGFGGSDGGQDSSADSSGGSGGSAGSAGSGGSSGTGGSGGTAGSGGSGGSVDDGGTDASDASDSGTPNACTGKPTTQSGWLNASVGGGVSTYTVQLTSDKLAADGGVPPLP